MKSRWLSARALWLHAALIVWVTGCVAASVWQVGRAIQGNTLSYMYSFEWPFFAVIGVVGWWALVHVDATEEALPTNRGVNEQEVRTAATHARERDRASEDAELAAYNDHLAALADTSKKRLFGH